MSEFKITVQYQTRDGYPAVAEFSQPDRYVVRAERRLRIGEDELLELRICTDAQAYGRQLGETLFQGSILEAFIRARANSADRMHVLLCIEAPELRALNWERLQAPLDDGRWDFLALDQRVPLSIYTPSSADRRFLAFGQRELRALIVAASPRRLADFGLSPFSALDTVMRVGISLGSIPYSTLASDAAAPNRLGPPTLDRLCEVLTSHRFTLLHIVCHGQLRRDGETVLYLDDAEGCVRAVPAAQLITRLARLRGEYGLPHFAFLAACESAHPDAEAALGGLGQRLVRELGMPAVVAMTARVSLDLATELSGRFYPRLQLHGAVDVALVEANAGLAEHADVLVPALYSRLGERALWSDRDDGRALTVSEIEYGLSRLQPLLEERAPTLLPEFVQVSRAVRERLERRAQAESEAGSAALGLLKEMAELEAISSEVLELSFRHIARGRSVPAYDGRCPFPGLNAFQPADSAFFFGREELVVRMSERILAHRFLAVLGPSGSGKSSVLLAGVLPELKRRQPGLQVIVMTPGKEPLLRLQHLLAPGDRAADSDPVAQPSAETLPLLLINQFEEVFTLCADPQQRRDFFARLLAARTSHAIVLSMRADFWGECSAYPELTETMLQHQELVGPMGSAELRRAIEGQLGAVGLRLEDGLCATMLSAIEDEPGSMPLLQHTLLELWKRRRGYWLRAQEYRNLGGVQLAIAETAEVIYQQSAGSPEEQKRMRDIFIRLTHLDEAPSSGRKPRDSRRSVAFSELVPVGTELELTRRMIAKLADARLLVTRADAMDGVQVVEVAHEAVIRHWPRLRSWLDEDRLAIGFREGVRQAAREWLATQRPEHLLLHRGERLRLVRELGTSAQHPFNRLEQDYIDACFSAQQAERLQKEAQLLRERQHAEELALALARALTAARTAQSRQLAMHSAAASEREPMLALLLAQEAARLLPTAEALSQIQAVLAGPLEKAILDGHRDAVLACAFCPQGELLLTASVDRTARIWDASGSCRAVLSGHQDAILEAVWSPDGQRILTISSDKTARLWSRSGEPLALLVGHQGPLLFGAWSPDGDQLLTCSNDHTACLWSSEGELVQRLHGHQDAVTSCRFHPDGGQLLTTSKDRTAHLWSRQGARLQVLHGHKAAISGGCFSPDGRLVLTASWDGTARLWDDSGAVVAILDGHTDRVNDACFSPDGSAILTVSRDHTARLWDPSGKTRAVLAGHEKSVHGGCFSADGARVLTISGDHVARLWDRAGTALEILRGHEKGVQRGCFSADDRRIATASWDGTARLWPGEGSCSGILRGHQGPLTQCSVSPDGGLLLTAADDRTVRLWDLESRRQRVLSGHTDLVTGAVFAADGSHVLTVSRDCTARLWSRDDGSLQALLAHADWVMAGAFSPNGAVIATAAIDGSVRLWSRDGSLRSLLCPGGASLTSCTFSPTSELLITTATDGTAILWGLDGSRRAILHAHRDSIASGVFSSDGERLLTASRDGSACISSVRGHELARLSGHTGALLGGCFNKDGSRVLTFSRDQTARLWSREGRLLAVLRGHRDWVLGGGIGEGDNLLTVSRDGTARIWRPDGELVMVLRGHRDWVTAGCFCRQDRFVVTASADHTARLWPATPDSLREAAAPYAVRVLTHSERDTYLDFERNEPLPQRKLG